MKKAINSSWYKITPEELKTKQYNNRNINELMAKAGYKDRLLQSKKSILPRIVNSAEKNNKTNIFNEIKNRSLLKNISNNKMLSAKKKQHSYQNVKINSSAKNKNTKVKKEEVRRRSKREMTRVISDDDICYYCLSFVEEPITLKCCHRICKNCLEEMITFNNFIKETQGTNKTLHDNFNIDNW